MVAIDTDVLVLAFAFHRDPRQEANSRFLQVMSQSEPVVAIYTVMELLGHLSFNLSAERLGRWQYWLQEQLGLVVLYPSTAGQDAEEFFREQFVNQPFVRMRQKPIPFLDALILGLVEELPEIEAFVTWNARHYRGKTTLPVYTPIEYLAR